MVDSKRRSSTSCNGQVGKGAVDLPQEIIADILSRLPIESILTCKIVCKTWYGMIRDPCFINNLSNSYHQPSQLILKPLRGKGTGDEDSGHLVLLDIEEQKTRHIPSEKMLLDLHIMCSCNGLLCMASCDKLNPVVIFNPITRERVILPSSGSKLGNHWVGLGFDPSTGKYKVVRAYFFPSNDNITRFEIIALGESSWRELSAPQNLIGSVAWGVVFWNGALYWRMIKGRYTNIVEFNLSDEKFHVISLPQNLLRARAFPQLIDMGGNLVMIQHFLGTIKLWKLTGKKGRGSDLSFCLQHSYDSHVNWGTALYCVMMRELKANGHLLQIDSRNSHCQRQHPRLIRSCPRRARCLHLEIPSLPDYFSTICFKPSLISPRLAASLCSQ